MNAPAASGPRKANLTAVLVALVAGLVAGVGVEMLLPANVASGIVDNFTRPVGDMWLAGIFMIVVPLLVSALILGVSDLGDVARVGRIGLRALLMTVLLSGLAVILGILAVNTIQPGRGIDPEQRESIIKEYQSDAEKRGKVAEAPTQDPPVLGLIPRNPLLEATRALQGGLLPLMVFAVVFGLGMAMCPPEQVAGLRAFLDGLFAVSQKVIEMVMLLAPIGVFCLVFTTGAKLGWEVFLVVGKYALLVLAVLAIHLFGVYSLVLAWVAKRDPRQFFRQMRTVMLTAFATSSSNATLPTALKSATEDVGLPKDVSSFVLTVGATANQNGTALFEGITILFFCQLFGIDLNMAQQLTVMGVCIVAGVGTAGVPGGAWPVIASVLAGLGVPANSIGLVLGIDRILDMSRTVLNVTGDMTIAACVAQMEGRGMESPESVQS
jgi:DAACS family dicarboxylate/amino acid:cation (Na+ or H+) symporter